MTIWQGIVTIIAALIAGMGGGFTFLQFMIKRKDDKAEKDVNKAITDAVAAAKMEIYAELNKVSAERSAEGAERFNTHAKSLVEVNHQIDENTKQIGELTEISKSVLESMESLSKVVKASAESQRNANYDRILFVGKQVIKARQITLSEKTNIKQLYESYKELQGPDPYIDTVYEECMRLTPVPDERD